MQFRRARLSPGLGALLLCGAAAAEPSQPLGPVTVTATRTAQSPFDVPASVDVVPGAAYSGDTLGVNLSEGLPAIPGLLARDRQDYAQDEQIAVRGFGARSTFGVRGVRLYLDDIPATQPDGQGQTSHFNLESIDRVEVLRGPLSSLYGNSSGGLIALYTANGTDPAQLTAAAAGGSYGTYRADLDARGTFRRGDYNAAYEHFYTDGYRQHSRAQRDSFNGKLNLSFGGAGRLSLLLNAFSSPEAQDPMGLTPAQFDANAAQAAAVATQFNTRKSVEQTQGGAIYEYAINPEQTLRVLGYLGNRQIRQFLSIPVASQASPLSPGGVVGLSTDYGGTDIRWAWHTRLAQQPFSLVAGLSYDDLSQQRRGYNNYSGDGSLPSDLGQQGSLRRAETDEVFDLDQYLQANWQFAEQWSALVGARHSQVRFDFEDQLVTATNPDYSGRRAYNATNPVAGLMYRYSEAIHLYASYGAGFETPTLNELAYLPNGAAGINTGLQAAHTNNGEFGAKLRLREHTRAGLAVFQALTRNELVIDTNSNGRSTYENAPRIRRQGVEASLDTELAPNWKLQLAYTYLDAVVRESYLTCTNTTCATATTPVNAGNRAPGVPEMNAYGELRWGGDTGWHAGLNAQYFGAVPVNDVNTVSAPSYALLGIDGGYIFDLPHWRVRGFVRIDNLLDTRYVGAISINDSNSRFFYSGTGRDVLAGVSVRWKD
jgi:iron complex outermembrane recepter protein